MKMSKLENKYYNTKRDIDKVAYKKQNNFVSRRYKKNAHAFTKI